MAGTEISSHPKLRTLLVVIVCLVQTTSCVKSRENATKSHEEFGFKDLLKAVEKHFDKLSARITNLETTVSSMQFFSIRQFNQISASLQTTNNDLGMVRKQVLVLFCLPFVLHAIPQWKQEWTNNSAITAPSMSLVEIDGRAQKISMSLLGRDVAELKKASSDVLGELESGMVYVSENMDKHHDLMMAAMEKALVKTANETTALMAKHIDETVLRNVREQTEPANCSLHLTGVPAHVDLRFAELKKQAHAHFVKLLAAVKTDLKKTASAREQSQEHKTTRERVDARLPHSKSVTEKVVTPGRDKATPAIVYNFTNTTGSIDTTTSVSPLEIITKNTNIVTSASQFENDANYTNTFEKTTNSFPGFENITNAFRGFKNLTTNRVQGNEDKDYRDEEDERVMNALYNMTYSVLQAVSFFRNTGDILEQILSNTDSLLHEQTDLSRRLGSLEVRQQTGAVNGNNGTGSVIQGSHYEGSQQAFKRMFSSSQPSDGRTDVPVAALDNIARIITNGSQLLEVLTDLAQMSSVSLSKVTADLQDELKRAESMRTQMATNMAANMAANIAVNMLAKAGGEESNAFASLHNTTHQTFKLVEAVASNAGWIPLIFQNVQRLESLTNRSLQIVTQNQEILSHVQQIASPPDSSMNGYQQENDPTFDNRIPQIIDAFEGMSYDDGNVSSKLEINLRKESVEKSFSPRSKLSRASTLLDKLLPERDHTLRIVSLNGSTNATEGRLEIFHKGAWTMICSDGWATTSADVACQQMGFSKGVPLDVFEWADGTNTTWLGKTTCSGLETRLDGCPNDGWTDWCPGLTPAGVSCL